MKKVLMVATEAAPYATAGGFASVVGYLSRALVSLGHDVRIFIPKFGFIDESEYGIKMLIKGLKVPTGDESTPELICNIKYLEDKSTGVTVYFLENQEYYEKRANVYGYTDDPTRFALLSRGVLEFIKTKEFVPDVIHCNDWHTGFVPNYIKTVYKKDPIINKISSVFTIHNLQFQGMLDHRHVSELDFDDGKSSVASFFDKRLEKQNFMKRGIIYADVVNTVSKTYSREILTPEFGEGLHKLLLELKGKVYGIINGLDYEEFNPATDGLINTNYDINSIDLRAENKKALQEEYGLPVNPNALLLSFVGRLDLQKGLDVAIDVLYNILKYHDIQFVQTGGGDGGLTDQLHKLHDTYPNKVGIHTHFDSTFARMIFAGADCVLYPSRFEPCGIVQIEGMRYGCVPIVRKVGGLADTVTNFDSFTKKGTGLVFQDFDTFSLYGEIVRAEEIFKNKELWTQLQKNGMVQDFSWNYSAKEYVKLYDRANHLREKSLGK